MFLFCTAVVFGILSLHIWDVLPNMQWLILVSFVTTSIALIFRYYWLLWFTLSASWALLYAHQYMNELESIPQKRSHHTIEVRVNSLINRNISSDFIEVSPIINTLSSYVLPSTFKLSWDQSTWVKQGQIWQIPVQFSRPYGMLNEAGFDSEVHAVGKGITRKGRVIYQADNLPMMLDSSVTYRQQFFDYISSYLVDLKHHAYLYALTFGYRNGLTADDWLILRDSGLAHLMAISGLHIGLAMLWGWGIGWFLRSLLPQQQKFLWLPLTCGFSFALAYAWLAGFSLPTQRALLMCLIAGGLLYARRTWLSWQIFLVTLTLCLVWNPLSSYASGFWLSFSAVWILFASRVFSGKSLSSPKTARHSKFSHKAKSNAVELVKLQFVLLIFMLPLQWHWFGGMSIWAPIINFIAVPWVSMVTVPLLFLAILTSWWLPASLLIWQLADWSLLPVLYIASWAKGGWWLFSENTYWILCGAIVWGISLYLVPLRQFIGGHISIFVLLCLFYWNLNNRSPVMGWKVHMLDVGHGLAILIEKNQQAWLYDTGSQWKDSSIARRVIAPVLAKKGIGQLDGFIISHSDNDHAGGTDHIVADFNPVKRRSSDNRSGFSVCKQGESWLWQGLKFEVLWPPVIRDYASNPYSCVISIRESGRKLSQTQILLTGDIDDVVELLLAKAYPQLTTEVLVVPHHGSATSSTHTWLDKLQPSYALTSINLYNPWRLPSQHIKERYEQRNIVWLTTANEGQISVQFVDNQIKLQRYRQDVATEWFRWQRDK
ncbi:TPA: DNA internalization-related competence protein ComEC/Rec2 [Photobacterium damselae]